MRKLRPRLIQLAFPTAQSLLATELGLEMKCSIFGAFPLTVMREVKTLHCQQPTFITYTYIQGIHHSWYIIIICYDFTPIKKPIQSIHVGQ